MKRNKLIGKVLNILIDEFNKGTCDDIEEETQDFMLDSLSKLVDIIKDKQDKILTIEEVSLYLNCTRLTVNNYVKSGKLKPKKHLGGVLEFKSKDIKICRKQ